MKCGLLALAEVVILSLIIITLDVEFYTIKVSEGINLNPTAPYQAQTNIQKTDTLS